MPHSLWLAKSPKDCMLFVLSGCSSGRRPADKEGYPLENNGDLRGATEFIRLGDFTSQHIHVPSGRRLRVLTDDVDVLKNEARISHNGFPYLHSSVLNPIGQFASPIRSDWTERVT